VVVVAVAVSLFTVCLPYFIYLQYRYCVYHRVLVLYSYPLPFPPITCPLKEYHTYPSTYQLPGPKLTHVTIHPYRYLVHSLARLRRRRRGDRMVFFFPFSFFTFIYLFTLSLFRSFLVMSLLGRCGGCVMDNVSYGGTVRYGSLVTVTRVGIISLCVCVVCVRGLGWHHSKVSNRRVGGR